MVLDAHWIVVILQYVHITEIVGIHCHRITSLFMIVKGCIQLIEFLYTDREQQMLTMVYKDGWYGRGDRDFTYSSQRSHSLWHSGGASGGDSGVFSCGGCGSLRLCLRLWSGPLSGADAPLTGGTDLDPHPACGVPCSAVVTVCHPPSLPIK